MDIKKYFPTTPIDVFLNEERLCLELNKRELLYCNVITNELRSSIKVDVALKIIDEYLSECDNNISECDKI